MRSAQAPCRARRPRAGRAHPAGRGATLNPGGRTTVHEDADALLCGSRVTPPQPPPVCFTSVSLSPEQRPQNIRSLTRCPPTHPCSSPDSACPVPSKSPLLQPQRKPGPTPACRPHPTLGAGVSRGPSGSVLSHLHGGPEPSRPPSQSMLDPENTTELPGDESCSASTSSLPGSLDGAEARRR